MKHGGKALFGVAVTVFLLWFVFRDVDPAEVWANIVQGNFALLFASVFVATFGFFIRAMRWKVLLAPIKPDTRLYSRFAAVSIGFMGNNVLPLRAGEFMRPYALSRLEPVTVSGAFGSLVVERFLDGIVLLLFLVVPVLLPGSPAADAFSEDRGSLLLRSGVVTVGLVLLALVSMAVMPQRFIKVVAWFARFLPKRVSEPLLGALESFLGPLAIMRDPKLLGLALAWTLFFWAWHAVSFWLAMLAFDIHTGFVSAMFVTAAVGWGVALPSAPGFFGTFHVAASFALTAVYGVAGGQALAFAFGYHFGGWLPITLIGFYYAWKMGLSLGEVRSAEEREESEAAADGAQTAVTV
ncbi:MAG: lysylphosphatidylglycerol synthase transmembrane domain-containing protein [Gemmatimonadota bacterium]|nr:lysylphosphatidylglycerol synthase transmembrane domain-containing protein [Gemmatimonadota bacterium]